MTNAPDHTFTLTVGRDEQGKALAIASASGDDIIGARAGTQEAAALRAVSLYFKLNPSAGGDNTFTGSKSKPLSHSAVGVPAIRALLNNAMLDDASVRIVYEDANGNKTERTIEPDTFIDVSGGEMVVAFDHLRGGMRQFYVDRIKRAEMV